MGVRMKLGLSYLAMVLMIVFLGIFALWSMSNMQKSADDAAVAALKYMKQSDNMNVAVSDYRAAMYKLLSAETPEQKTAAYAEIRKTAKVIDDTFAEMSDGIIFVDKLNEAKKKELSDSAAELDELKDKIEKAEAEASVGRERSEKLGSERDRISGIISDMQLRRMGLEKDRENAEAAVEELKKTAEEKSGDSAGLLLRIKEQEVIIKEKQKDIEDRNRRLSEASDDSGRINSQISEYTQKRDDFERRSNENRIRSSELNSTKESYGTEKTRLEERIRSVNGSVDKIVADMLEQYNISRSEAARIASPVECRVALHR